MRIFVFADGIDEVTEIMQTSNNIAEAAQRIDENKVASGSTVDQTTAPPFAPL